MKERILQLCKRLNKFTLDELETITETDRSELVPILSELINENKITEINCQYVYIKKVSITEKYSIFSCHSSTEIEIIIRCFCVGIPAYKASLISGIYENQAVRFYDVFRTLLYERQEKQLKSFFEKRPQQGRNRMFFDTQMHFYVYENQVFVSDVLLNGGSGENFSPAEIQEFKKVYSYLTRNTYHNKSEKNLKSKLAEFIWRRNQTFEDLYFDLKHFLNLS